MYLKVNNKATLLRFLGQWHLMDEMTTGSNTICGEAYDDLDSDPTSKIGGNITCPGCIKTIKNIIEILKI